MRKVAILTPAYDASVSAYFYHSVVNTVRACSAKGIEVYPLTWPGEALLQHARNALVKRGLSWSMDDYFWIDADQEWTPEQFLAILAHDVDVVGATYRKKTDDETYTVRVKGTLRQRGNLLVVDGLGTGFLKVSRKALVAVANDSEPYENNGEEWPMVFNTAVIDGRLHGEDMIFCAKLAALDYPIHFDPSFTVAHWGSKKYVGDFLDFVEKKLPADHYVACAG